MFICADLDFVINLVDGRGGKKRFLKKTGGGGGGGDGAETRKKKEVFLHPVLSMHSFFSLAAFSGFSHLLSVGLLIYHTVPLHDNQLQQMSLQASSWSRDRRIFRTTVRAEMHFPGKISLYFVSEQHERKWCFLKIKIQRTTLFKELRYL